MSSFTFHKQQFLRTSSPQNLHLYFRFLLTIISVSGWRSADVEVEKVPTNMAAYYEARPLLFALLLFSALCQIVVPSKISNLKMCADAECKSKFEDLFFLIVKNQFYFPLVYSMSKVEACQCYWLLSILFWFFRFRIRLLVYLKNTPEFYLCIWTIN